MIAIGLLSYVAFTVSVVGSVIVMLSTGTVTVMSGTVSCVVCPSVEITWMFGDMVRTSLSTGAFGMNTSLAIRRIT